MRPPRNQGVPLAHQVLPRNQGVPLAHLVAKYDTGGDLKSGSEGCSLATMEAFMNRHEPTLEAGSSKLALKAA